MGKKNANTRGTTTLWEYFLDLLELPDFQNKLSKIKAKHSLELSERAAENARNKYFYVVSNPKKLDFPKISFYSTKEYSSAELDDLMRHKEKLEENPDIYNLEGYPLKNQESLETDQPSLLFHDIHELCGEYNLDSFFWLDSILQVLCGEKLTGTGWGDLCFATDYVATDIETKEEGNKEMMDKVYPVMIRVSPYASKNDIISYVERHYKDFIKPLQWQHADGGSRIGRNKKRNPEVRERNNFIFEKRELGFLYKKIVALTNKKYGGKLEVDEGSVGKIISLENKKRRK